MVRRHGVVLESFCALMNYLTAHRIGASRPVGLSACRPRAFGSPVGAFMTRWRRPSSSVTSLPAIDSSPEIHLEPLAPSGGILRR
jgi:hypothetical protein